MENHFLVLEELIKDNDEIVTVASFAFKTQISIEESQNILEQFIKINNGSNQISATYILNGRKKGEDQLSVSLVKDSLYEEEKKLYQEGVKQIIFSIQKVKNVDFSVLALVDPIISTAENLIVGAVVGKNCIKRKLRKKLLPVLPPPKVKGKSTIFTKQNSAVKSESHKVESNGVTNNKITVGNAHNNIATLFNKAALNRKPQQKDLKQHEIKKQKSNGGLQSFFTKKSSEVEKDNKKETQEQKELQLVSKDKKVKKNDENKADSDTDDDILKDLDIKDEELQKTQEKKKPMNPSKKQDHKSDLFDTDTDDDTQKHFETKKEEFINKNTQKETNTSSQKKKRRKNDVGNDKAAKKRKRIIVKDDSDSDDIFGGEKSDSEDLIEKSDEEPEPVKRDKRPLAPRNKKRKAVDKIYEDEDGYIVTKTEYVYVTASEDENEPETKISKVQEPTKPKIEKKESTNSESDISPNKNTKNKKGSIKKVPSSGSQPTLMNFFKKK